MVRNKFEAEIGKSPNVEKIVIEELQDSQFEENSYTITLDDFWH